MTSFPLAYLLIPFGLVVIFAGLFFIFNVFEATLKFKLF